MRTYGQYCPIARTSELLSERWTPILIRNLLAGCETFGELLAVHQASAVPCSPSASRRSRRTGS
jgi:DNA-binding HxlR family transcriptional regulator